MVAAVVERKDKMAGHIRFIKNMNVDVIRDGEVHKQAIGFGSIYEVKDIAIENDYVDIELANGDIIYGLLFNTIELLRPTIVDALPKLEEKEGVSPTG